MNDKNLNSLVSVAIVVIVFQSVWFGVRAVTGTDSPFTVVESHSMQHSQHSDIGIIDTGDVVLVKDPSKCKITTYVEGYQNGYTSFGDFGNVIVYERAGHNPIIHRAFLWLDYNGDSTWSAPSLQGYDKWECSGKSYSTLSGTITFFEVGNVAGKKLSINLDNLLAHYQRSGYLTLGDSISNDQFDQVWELSDGLVTPAMIKSVAWKELPWLGSIKLMLSHNDADLKNWAPDQINLLVSSFIVLVLLILGMSYLYEEHILSRTKKQFPNPPTPLFPLQLEGVLTNLKSFVRKLRRSRDF